jgi:hypothetical protein
MALRVAKWNMQIENAFFQGKEFLRRNVRVLEWVRVDVAANFAKIIHV